MATYYADSAGSQGTGDGSSAANACTLKQFIENDAVLHTALAAGAICYVKNGTTISYDGSAGDFMNTAAVAGTATAPIRVEGYAATPGDGGVVEIADTGGGLGTGNCITVDQPYWHFLNLKLTDVRIGFHCLTGGAGNGFLAHNVHATAGGNGSYGITIGGDTGDCAIISSCSAVGFSSAGFSVFRRAARLCNCVAIGCGAGFIIGNASYGAVAVGCLAHGCSGDGFQLSSTCMLVNCTSDGNGSDGYYISSMKHATALISCIASNNGAYGVEGVASTSVHAINCMLHPDDGQNTSGKNSANVTLIESSPVSGDVDYVDRANDNFAVAASGAAHEAGARLGGAGWTSSVTYADLGAVQRAETASGGGGTRAYAI